MKTREENKKKMSKFRIHLAAVLCVSMLAFVGCGSEEADSCHAHHSPKFKVDEKALIQSAMLYCQVAADFLK